MSLRDQKRKIKQQLDFLHDKFSIEINYKTFVDHYKKIVPHIQTIGKTKVADKNEILNSFSLENWEKLCCDERKCHTIVECKGCHRFGPFAQWLYVTNSC